MKFLASAEVEREAFATADAMRRVFLICSEELNDDSRSIDFSFAYIPIIIPYELKTRFRERFRYNKKQKIFYSSPHLRYDIFVLGTTREQIQEYINGIIWSLNKIPQVPDRGEIIQQLEQTTWKIRDCMNATLCSSPPTKLQSDPP